MIKIVPSNQFKPVYADFIMNKIYFRHKKRLLFTK